MSIEPNKNNDNLKMNTKSITKLYNVLEKENKYKKQLEDAQKKTEELSLPTEPMNDDSVNSLVMTKLNENANRVEEDSKSILGELSNEIKDAFYDYKNASYDDIEDDDNSNIENDDDSDFEFSDDVKSIIYRDMIKRALKEANLNLKSDQELELVLDLILEYRQNKAIDIYSKLPYGMKLTIDALWKSFPKSKQVSTTKNSLARNLFDNIIFQLKGNIEFDILDKDMTGMHDKIESEISSIIDDAYQDLFSKIDELKEVDPDKAVEFQKVKDAYYEAMNFDRLKEYVNHCKPREVRKFANRYTNACHRFNKLVNSNPFSVTIPRLEDIYELLKVWVPVDKDYIKEFCVLLSEMITTELDFTDIGDVTYTHRFINRIYSFRFKTMLDKDIDEANEVFGEIRNIIEMLQYRKTSTTQEVN